MDVISSPFPDRIIIIKSYTLDPNTTVETYFGNFIVDARYMTVGETIKRKIKLDFVVFLQSSANLSIYVSNDGGNTEYPIFLTLKNKTTYGTCIPVPKIPLHTVENSYYKIGINNPLPFTIFPEVMFVFEILEEEPLEELPEQPPPGQQPPPGEQPPPK
jgi:hypothetical protein